MQKHAVFLTINVPIFLSISKVLTLPATKNENPIAVINPDKRYCHQCLNEKVNKAINYLPIFKAL
jgi:hypothetical protein